MKLNDFKKMMLKPVFTWEEAKMVAFKTPPAVLKVQLNYWKKRGELTALKRGVYLFPERKRETAEIAKALYSPCYFSLESALHYYGLIPDVVFASTLVTTKATRTFKTPVGHFIYHKIKLEAFLGYDSKTLMAEPEKVLVDYLYLHRHRFVPKNDFWEEMRFQNLEEISFRKCHFFAKYFQSKKLMKLLESLKAYAKLDSMG